MAKEKPKSSGGKGQQPAPKAKKGGGKNPTANTGHELVINPATPQPKTKGKTQIGGDSGTTSNPTPGVKKKAR